MHPERVSRYLVRCKRSVGLGREVEQLRVRRVRLTIVVPSGGVFMYTYMYLGTDVTRKSTLQKSGCNANTHAFLCQKIIYLSLIHI